MAGVAAAVLLGAFGASGAQAADITANPSTVYTGTPVTLSVDTAAALPGGCPAVSYAWNIQDGNPPSSDQSSPTVSFSTTGTKNVTVDVSSDPTQVTTADPTVACPSGVQRATTLSVSDPPPPNNSPPNQPAITFTPAAPTAGGKVRFTATFSGAPDPDGDAVTYVWNFGDGSGTTTTSSATTFHPYDQGTYQASVYAVDSHNASGPSSTAVSVAVGPAPVPDQPPVAGAITVNSSGHRNTAVSFSVPVSDADSGQLSYSWNFGDGQTSPGTTAVPATLTTTHSYAQPGSYNVKVSVSDGQYGDSSTTTSPVVINDQAPTASFIFTSPNVVALGTPITVQSTSTDPDGDALSYAWDFGLGSGFAAGSATASITYTSTGTKVVRLKVSDGPLAAGFFSDVSDPQTVTVSNHAPPIPSFTFSPASPVAGANVTFTSTSTDPSGPITGLKWDLDRDGQFDDAAGATAQRVFPAPGTYIVSLRASDANFPDGAQAPASSQSIVVVAPPAVTIPGVTGTSTEGTPTSPTPTTPVVTATSTRKKATILQPVPIVRVSGDLVGTGVRITRLSVRAPVGARVKATCTGGGCPKFKHGYVLSVKKHRPGVTLTLLQRRLDKDAVIQIFVSKTGFIGKYTSFKIRSGKSPQRRDACVAATKVARIPCPSS